MDSKQNIRKKIIERINRLSDDKLKSVDNYIDQIESEIKSKQSIISYSGIFKDLDTEFHADLTENLHDNRFKGSNRIP